MAKPALCPAHKIAVKVLVGLHARREACLGRIHFQVPLGHGQNSLPWICIAEFPFSAKLLAIRGSPLPEVTPGSLPFEPMF